MLQYRVDKKRYPAYPYVMVTEYIGKHGYTVIETPCSEWYLCWLRDNGFNVPADWLAGHQGSMETKAA